MEKNNCIICRCIVDVKRCNDCCGYVCCSCIESQKSISFVIKKHNKCMECIDEICCYKPICSKCDIHPYHMITSKIAVGSCASKYDDFDVIINLNYPENNVKENKTSYQKKDDKLIIRIGLSDSLENEKEAYQYMCEIIPVLNKYYSDKKILFHCFSGISRSAAFIIAYLSYSTGQCINYSYNLVKNNRKFIQPNKAFMKALENFQIYCKNTI